MRGMARQAAGLLTTRFRAAVAVVLTALLLRQAVRGALTLGNTPAGWPFPADFLLHGWPLVALNVAFYGYMWWLAYAFIHITRGQERVVVVGWFASVLLWPLKAVQHGWIVEVRYIGALGYALALIAAVLILLWSPPSRPRERVSSDGSAG
jgi:hypothetical protein